MGLYARCSVAKDRLVSGELSGLFVNDPDGLYLHAWLEGAPIGIWVKASDLCSDWPIWDDAGAAGRTLGERDTTVDAGIGGDRNSSETLAREGVPPSVSYDRKENVA